MNYRMTEVRYTKKGKHGRKRKDTKDKRKEMWLGKKERNGKFFVKSS